MTVLATQYESKKAGSNGVFIFAQALSILKKNQEAAE